MLNCVPFRSRPVPPEYCVSLSAAQAHALPFHLGTLLADVQPCGRLYFASRPMVTSPLSPPPVSPLPAATETFVMSPPERCASVSPVAQAVFGASPSFTLVTTPPLV